MIIYMDMDDVLCNFKEAYANSVAQNCDLAFAQF